MNCEKCKCPCLLISLSCLLEQATILNDTLDPDDLKTFMDKAQKDYVLSIIQEDCLKELCKAIGKSEYPPSHEDYEELPEHWEDLLSNLRELVVAGTEYLYVARRGMGNLNKEGFSFIDDTEPLNSLTGTLKADVKALQHHLREWLRENSNRYSCFSYVPNTCDEDDEQDDDLYLDFEVIE